MNKEFQNIGPISTFELTKLRDFFQSNQFDFETEIDVIYKVIVNR